MRTRDVQMALAGGTLIYVITAACSATTGDSHSASSTTGGSVSDGGRPGSASSGGASGGSVGPIRDAAAQETSGSRLKATNYVGADGSRQFAGWYDPQIGASCYFGQASDGSYRCLPTAVVAYGTYADAACSKAIISVTGGACPVAGPKFASVIAGCAFEIRSVGAELAPGAMVYSGTAASCIASQGLAGYRYFAVGAAVPLSNFVSATLSM